MSKNIEITVENIFEHLLRLDRSIASSRRVGLTDKTINDSLSAIGLQAPPAIIELYTFCDGTDTPKGSSLDTLYFFPAYLWMKLEDSIQTYLSLLSSEQWNKYWLPIFASGGGDFYAVVCNQDSPDYGGVVGFILGEKDHLVEFESIFAMFQAVDEAFKQNAFFVADGYLEADYTKFMEIARNIQPDFVEHEAIK